MTAPHVLLVEDDFLIRVTLAEALEEDGFAVTQAGTGEEALRHLQQADAPALLVTDLRLPGAIDGLALVEAARALVPTLPVLFTTGRADLVAASLGSSGVAVVAKPYVPWDVTRAARRLLGL